MASLIATEFRTAKETAQSWKESLKDMQSRAFEARRKAKSAEFRLHDAQRKIEGLQKEAEKDDSPNPIISAQLHGVFGGGGLEGEAADAQAEIDAAQKTIDEIRDEYDSKSSDTISAYKLSSVDGIYQDSPRGNPFSKSIKVVDDLGALNADYLDNLASKASDSPEQLEKYLDALSELDADDLTEYFASNPDASRYPMAVSDQTVQSALVVKDWWASLDEEQRAALIDTAPAMIGNLNGITYADRDKANRWLLKKVAADPTTDPDTLALLESLRKAAKSEKPPRYITSLDLSNLKKENEDNYGYNNVLASVSLGSLDDADKVSIVVPGMTNNISNLEDLTQVGMNIYQEQERALKAHGDDKQKVAVNLWVGYETPPELGAQAQHPDKLVTDIELAQKGGQNLAKYIDGVNATKSQTPFNSQQDVNPSSFEDPFISIISHSYGTTTTGEAMQNAETNVDNVVLYGSAGIGYKSVIDSNWGEGWKVDRTTDGKQKIYYTDSSEDWTAPGGYLPGWIMLAISPALAPFISQENRVTPELMTDAQRFQSTEGIGADGQYYEDVDTHSFESKPGEQGFAHMDTTSLTYGVRASLDYSDDLHKKFYEPWYFEKDYKGEPIMKCVTTEDLVNGKVPSELMEKIKSSQNIQESDLLNIE